MFFGRRTYKSHNSAGLYPRLSFVSLFIVCTTIVELKMTFSPINFLAHLPNNGFSVLNRGEIIMDFLFNKFNS